MSRAKHPSGILKAAAAQKDNDESTLSGSSGGVEKKSVRIQNNKRRAKPGSGNFRRVITLQMGEMTKSTLMRYQPFSRLMRSTIHRICKESNLRLVNRHKAADGTIQKMEAPFAPRVSDHAIEDAKQYVEAFMHKLFTVSVDSAVTAGHKQVSRRDFRLAMVTTNFVPRESVFKLLAPSGRYDPHKPAGHEDRAEPKRDPVRKRHVRNATIQLDVFRRPRQHKSKEELEEEAQAKASRKKERAQKAAKKAEQAEKRAKKAAAAVVEANAGVVADNKKQAKAKKSKKRAAADADDEETAAGSIDEVGQDDEDEAPAVAAAPRKALGKKQAVAGKKRAAAASK